MNQSKARGLTDRNNQGILIHLFLFLFVFLIGIFFIWAYYGRLDVVSIAYGEIIPSTKIKSVQHLEGGIVRKILIKEGERVNSGQPLVTLEPLRSGTDVTEIRMRLNRLEFALARLNAESQNRPKLVLPKHLSNDHPRIAKQTTQLFSSRRKRIKNELNAQEQRIEEQKKAFEEIEVRILNNTHRLTLLDEQVKISTQLIKDQLSHRMQHLDLLKEAAALRGKITEDQKAAPRAKASWKAALARLAATREGFIESTRVEQTDKQREFDELSNRLKKFEDKLRRTVLRSPVNGLVKKLYVATIGGVVKPGGTVVDIVPQGDKLIVLAKLSTQDIGYIRKGQSALVKLTSRDSSKFGHIKGKVAHISPDSVETPDGIPYYEVQISTEKTFFQSGAVKYTMVPGVQVSCFIRTGERTVLEYLLDPFLNSADTAFRER